MIKYKSYGKVNLSLEVIKKRTDGYHEIDSLMHKIDLWDELAFDKRSDNKIKIHSDTDDLPLDESNLVFKAWKLMARYKNQGTGVDIYIKKNIPIAAGLGGGTSNGVLTMKVLNEIWNLSLSKDRLIELAKDLGADSTFFFYDGLVRVRGIGEKIQPLSKIKAYYLLLVNIGKHLSSARVYQSMSKFSSGRIDQLVGALPNLCQASNLTFNNMEDVSFSIYPELQSIKDKISQTGACFSLMSGAGPTVFGLYEDSKTRNQAFDQLKDSYPIVLKSRLV